MIGLSSELTDGLKLDKKNTKDMVKLAARIADSKGADYINILEMKKRLIITDYFLIIGTQNTRLSASLTDEIKLRLKTLGLIPINTTGSAEANWILIDYNDFVIHIFTEEFRQYYDLERLWKDSKNINWK